jgi:uracil phosphoribosyltransferase
MHILLIAAAFLCTALFVHADTVEELEEPTILEQIQVSRGSSEILSQLLPIVHCSFNSNKYERILLTQLRNIESSTQQFRAVSEKLGDLLVSKVVSCLPTKIVTISTPVSSCEGEVLASGVELVSIMRSGDALLDTFMRHFPNANVSKILIQRDEETSLPQFQYMKVSPTLSGGNTVIITEPMIATGGTLEMVLSLLKERGVQEKNILIASICVAPEGLLRLNAKFPEIRIVMSVLDDRLNEKKYIVPGLGDFGDRFFGTVK